VIKPFEPSLLVCTVEIAMRKSSEMRGLREALRSGGATGIGEWFIGRSNEAMLANAMEMQRESYESHALSVASGIEAGLTSRSIHADRFARFAVTIAAAASCTPSEIESVRRAAPWHDVGMVEVVDLLRDAPGVWQPGQLERMRGHCEAGAASLARQGAVAEDGAVRMAVSHHERWDGSGYPRGLRGEEIPLEGRVAAVADALDAMTSPRSYRTRLSWEAAIGRIAAESGSAFDPRFAEAAVRASHQLRQIAELLRDA
jgi:response regulator RpfG family c-di-GMP phosphodiesterase